MCFEDVEMAVDCLSLNVIHSAMNNTMYKTKVVSPLTKKKRKLLPLLFA